MGGDRSQVADTYYRSPEGILNGQTASTRLENVLESEFAWLYLTIVKLHISALEHSCF